MTYKKTDPQYLQIRQIHRKRLQRSLVLAAVLAVLVTGCGRNSNLPSSSSNPTSRLTNQNANDKIPAVFYKNAEQCKADIKKQQEEYGVLVQAHQQGKLSKKPTPPIMKVEDCEAQMQAAMREHNRNAPVYSKLEDCQSEGLQCEATPAGSRTSGYRPTYGGTYFYPQRSSEFIYINYGGTNRRVYRPHTVYQSSTPGKVVTPYGRTVTQTKSGQVTAPRHTSLVAPQRPTGTAGRGTIKGRSSRGFGSTYKSTGRGGK